MANQKQLPREFIDNYSGLLGNLTKECKTKMLEELQRVDLSDIAQAREEIITIMQAYLGAYTDMAAEMAATFFDGVRTFQGVKGAYSAVAAPGYNPAQTEEVVRAVMQTVVDDPSAKGALLKKLEQSATHCVKSAAANTTEYNVRKDPAKPRYARVPKFTATTYNPWGKSGTHNKFLAENGTCRFCMMLASRGFVYYSKKSAGAEQHWHDGCDCVIVQSYNDAGAEGYDPEECYDRWKHPEKYEQEAISESVAVDESAFKPFKAATSIEDALQFAHSQFGVDTMGVMYDKIGLEGANLINEGLYRVKQVLGDVSLRDIRYKATLANNPSTVAAYNPAWNGLFFSKRIKGKNALTNMGKLQAEQYDIGWWSSKNPFGTVYHEMGHYAYHVIDGHGSSACNHYLDLLRERYRKEAAQGEDVDWSRWGREGTSLPVSVRARDNGLSGYALMNNDEMVAEAFAQLYDGNVSKQSREVLKTLLEYGSNINKPENAEIKRRLEQL